MKLATTVLLSVFVASVAFARKVYVHNTSSVSASVSLYWTVTGEPTDPEHEGDWYGGGNTYSLPVLAGETKYLGDFSTTASDYGGEVQAGTVSGDMRITYLQPALISEELIGNSYVATGGSAPAEEIDIINNEGIPDGSFQLGVGDDIIYEFSPLQNRPATPDESKTLWMVEDTTLTADLFREGVDKIVYAAAASDAGGGGSGGMTKDEFTTTSTEAVAEAQLAANAANPSPTDLETESAAARAAAEASVTEDVPGIGSATIPSANSVLSINVPVVGTIDLDPMARPEIATYCNFVKAVSGWAMILVFAWWTWSEFQKIVAVSVTVTQARGNPVVGGTGAQATALLAATLIAAVMIGIPAAYWLLVSVDRSALSSNPFSGSLSSTVSAGLYLLGCVFPYPLALTLLGAAFVVRKGGTVLVLGVSAAIKFIVP